MKIEDQDPEDFHLIQFAIILTDMPKDMESKYDCPETNYTTTENFLNDPNIEKIDDVNTHPLLRDEL